FALYLKPAADKSGYYEFRADAAGTLRPMFYPQRGDKRFEKDDRFRAEIKVRLDGTLNQSKDRDRGWTVEGRIPWRDLSRTGGRPEPGETWTFAIIRVDAATGHPAELSASVPLSKPDAHRHEEYATLRFVGPDARTARKHGIDKRI